MTKAPTEQQIRKIIENGTREAAKVCEQKFYGKPKSLTEQWREGTLKSGAYYIKVKFGDNLIYTFDYYNDRNNEWNFFRDIREVLDIVPSYEEYRELLDLNVYEKDRKKVMGLEDKVKRLQEKLSESETIFKIIKRNMENPNWHKDRSLTDLEIAIKSQVCGYIERYGVK